MAKGGYMILDFLRAEKKFSPLWRLNMYSHMGDTMMVRLFLFSSTLLILLGFTILPEASAAPSAPPMPEVTLEEVSYTSSLDQVGPLYASFSFVRDGKPKPIVAVMHGYGESHETPTVAAAIREFAGRGLFCIAPDMRGRGRSAGKFDASGLTIHDILDAIVLAAKQYPNELDSRNVNIFGGSGGGGNSFAAIIRFPDLFHVSAPIFGIPDYYLWYRVTRLGQQYVVPTFGGAPDALPQVYDAQSFTFAAGNNQKTRLHVFCDEEEAVCPIIMDRIFLRAYHVAGGTNAVAHFSNKESTIRWAHGLCPPDVFLRAMDIIEPDIKASVPDLLLPKTADLTVCGFVVTRDFQVFVEDGTRGIVKIHCDLRNKEPQVTVTTNPDNLKTTISYTTPIQALLATPTSIR